MLPVIALILLTLALALVLPGLIAADEPEREPEPLPPPAHYRCELCGAVLETEDGATFHVLTAHGEEARHAV